MFRLFIFRQVEQKTFMWMLPQQALAVIEIWQSYEVSTISRLHEPFLLTLV